MSGYIVSARKFRPQRFDEVSSQEFITQTLKNAKLTNKIAHSYLLSGPRGVGKTTIARIFAKLLNCLDPKDGEPCNECDNCVEITSGIHPDVFELDAASNRGIDDVRAIQDAAKFFPLKAKYKFFIVDEVHMLTLQAFNAMLKILEEPPEYLIFILATTNPEKIPQTILSRCQKFSLLRLKIDEISKTIKEIAGKEKIKIDDESVFLISKLGDGALRDALGIFDMAVSYCGNDIKFSELKEFLNLPDKEIFFNISKFISEGNSKEILNYFNKLEEQGFDLQTFYNGITEHFRNLLIMKTTGNQDLLDESDLIKKRYKEESEQFSEDQIMRLQKIMFEAEARFKYSANQKILMEAILVELCRVNRDVVDLSNLISDLENIKKKTGKLNYPEPTQSEIKIKLQTPASKSVRTSTNKEQADKVKNSTNDQSDSDLVKKLKDLFDAEEFRMD
jgi:DNA polymerase-3 subunit gamma/tau